MINQISGPGSFTQLLMLPVGLFGGGCETEENICEIALTRWHVYDLVLKNVWALELYIPGQAWPLPSCVTAGRSPHLCELVLGKDMWGKNILFSFIFGRAESWFTHVGFL